MISVKIEVQLNGITIQHESETLSAMSANNTVITEKAASMLLEGYHKVKKGIESQR